MTEVAELKQRSALSGWPMILGWAAMLIFTFHACTRMVAAGDTWVAMACGRHFINHGVDTVEPFSANSHDAGPTAKEIKTWPKWAQSITETVGLDTVKYWHPTGWVNQNWLTHVVFYWLTHLSPFADADTYSYNTLVYLKFAIYIITTVCVFYTCRQLKVNAALAAAFSCFAIFVGRSYLDIRPAGFSNVMVAILLFLFVLATYKNILYIWLIVPIAVLWCNLHGGYLYLFIMLVPFVGLNFLTSFFPNRFVTVGRKGLYHAIGAGITALLAMIVFNPFHLTNLTHTFIISLSKHAEMWRTINEWRPAFSWTNPVGTGFSFLVLFILSIGTLILWLFSKLLMPRLLKAPKNELERQQKTYNILTMIFTYVAAVFAGWVVFISFSFLKLDATSFIFCLLFVIILLLAVLKNVHFIYLAIALSMAALWSAGSMKGYAGRYIYPFVIIPCYVTADILSSVIAEKSKRKWLDIVFVSATAIASVVLVVWIIDPFKFKLPFWNMEQLWNIRRLIRPAYEKNVSVNYRYLFKVLYIVNGASLAFWLSFPYLRKLFSMRPAQTSQPLSETNYKLPKIDLALIAIASLTVYMALRSRRFIPIAGVAACPVVAMFIDQMIRTISASRNFHKEKRLVVSSMSCGVRRFFIVLGVFAVVGFGSWWGLKFKRIYIDACMSGGELTSVFMRMTASHEKPFYAGNFIRENKLAGKMFNAWTEGGFIALSQEPDPETGRTPLQLFMDGRAQAAYDVSVFSTWGGILSGGPTARSVQMRKQQFTVDDYAKIGQWINKQLQQRFVWVVLMPQTPQTTVMTTALEQTENWRIVFLNNKQKLFVDVTKPRGKELFDGVLSGKTIFSDEFTRNLTYAYHAFAYGEGDEMKKRGLKHAVKALEIYPSVRPMQQIVMAGRHFYSVRNRGYKICEKFIYDFEQGQEGFAKEHGYQQRLAAVIGACSYLQSVGKTQKNTPAYEAYTEKKATHLKTINELIEAKKW